MDVNKNSFYPLLPDILADISQAHFVAIDLELSGVPTKQSWSGRGKPSLQERYSEIKDAADKYQILQIGLTCVREDIEKGRYVCQPYNFDISPLIEVPGLDVDRDFAFNSSAVDFLKKVGFDLSKPFNIGVPYLSRSESHAAHRRHDERQEKGAVADMHIKDTDIEALALMKRVRKEITAWLSDKSPSSPSYLNIAPVGSDRNVDANPPAELSRFEKRLVHQLVRAEYPELVTISKRGSIQIVHFNAQREARIVAERKAEFQGRINRQKGFRWIVEALLGSNLGGLDLRLCASDPVTGEPVFGDIDQYKARFDRAQSMLRGRPRVLVGHNCFLDFVYLYRTFIAPLPDTVEEFCYELHERWPIILDTKYMATHNCGDINPMSSLEEIARQLSGLGKDLDEVDEKHHKYKDVEVFHEAGFDSLLTAQIAVRLSVKLEKEGTYIGDVEDLNDQGGVKVEEGIQPTTTLSAAVQSGRDLMQNAMKSLNLTSAIPTSNTENHASSQSTSHSQSTDAQEVIDFEDFQPSDPALSWNGRGDPTIGPNAEGDPFKYDPSDRKHQYVPSEEQQRGIKGGMPRWTGDFWRVYGNRMRVFGTEEGVCALEGQ